MNGATPPSALITEADPLHIACAVNDRYVPYLAAMLDSMFQVHPGSAVQVHLLQGSDRSPRLPVLIDWAASRGCTIIPCRVDDVPLASLPTLATVSRETWFRVLLPELLPSLDRVLYLDVDIYVAEALDVLWTTSLGSSLVAAVSNLLPHHYADRPMALGLPAHVQYFNAGVLLMNLREMRAQRSSEAIVSYAHENASTLALSDQDALNAVLGPTHEALHPRWNCQTTMYEQPDASRALFGDDAFAEAVARPAIIHFEGPLICKPWHALNSHPWAPNFRRSLERTPWPHLPLIEANRVNRLIAKLPSRWHVATYARSESVRSRVRRVTRPDGLGR